MSVESAKDFCLRMGTDRAFLDKLDTATSVDEHYRLAHEGGFDFTADEFETATYQIAEAGSLQEALGEQQAEVVGYLAGSFLQIQQTARTFYGDGGIGLGVSRPGTLASGPCSTWFRAL